MSTTFRQSCEKSFLRDLVDGSQRRSKLKIRLGVPVAPSRWLERWDGPTRMVPTNPEWSRQAVSQVEKLPITVRRGAGGTLGRTGHVNVY